MPKTIWKFPLVKQGSNFIDMPIQSEVIYAGVDSKTGTACVWAIVPSNRLETETVEFVVCGTGHDLPDKPLKFIGTATDGVFFWHIFRKV